MPTHVMNIYDKFHWNPPTMWTEIAAREIDEQGRKMDWRPNRIPENKLPPLQIIRWQMHKNYIVSKVSKIWTMSCDNSEKAKFHWDQLLVTSSWRR